MPVYRTEFSYGADQTLCNAYIEVYADNEESALEHFGSLFESITENRLGQKSITLEDIEEARQA